MGAIILSILSVIGWILLVLLIILVVSTLLVLLYPVTYRIKGHKNEQETILQVKANWMFHLVRFRFLYPTPGKPQCKVLFWDLLTPKTKSKNKKAPKEKVEKKKVENEKAEIDKAKKKKTENHSQESDINQPIVDRSIDNSVGIDSNTLTSIYESSETEGSPSDHIIDSPEAEGSPSDHVIDSTKIEGNTAEQVKISNEAAEDSSKQYSETEESVNKEQKLNFLERIQKAIRLFIDKIKNLIHKIQQIRNNITYYIDLLQDKSTKAVLSRLFEKIGKILKHTKPRRIKADLLVGTGSPDTTGYMMGLYGVLLPHIGNKVNLTPDFTQAIVQGEFEIKGHITLLVITINLIKIALDKELRQLIKKLKNGGNQNG